MKKISSLFENKLLIILLSLFLTACGGAVEGTIGSVILSGSVGDGPIINSTVTVKNVNAVTLATTVSDDKANYSLSVTPSASDYPLIISSTGGIDLVTGTTPDFEMLSIVSDSSQIRANLNPFSTFIVKTAQAMPGGLTIANVTFANNAVLSKLNFGFDQILVPDPISTIITKSNIAVIVKASETLAEMVRRTRDAVGGNTTADDVIAALGADLTDGDMDGAGSAGSIPRISALANVISGPVLLEALSNDLKVGNMSATALMDNAISITMPDAPSTAITDNVSITSEMLVQAITAINAAQVIDSGADLDVIENTLSGITAGSLPADVVAFQSSDLDSSINLVLNASNSQLISVNAVVSVNNNAPSNGGTPAPSNPAPSTPAPSTPAPSNPAPSNNAPVAAISVNPTSGMA
ncbi:MAG: hypothetical protein KAS48_02885, partial [Gammaproteobacteria bacterium]|nr:hypothetical protein [Gammaproteobacteria bacterium]